MTTARLTVLLIAASTFMPAAGAQDPLAPPFQEIPAVPAVAAGHAPGHAAADEALPDEARKLIAAFDREAAAIQEQARQQIAARRKQVVADLKKMQDDYTRPGKLDQAVAIRDAVRRVGFEHDAEVRPAPQNLMPLREAVGKTFYFRVTGRRSGFIFGTDIYTDDSDLATAAVHAGAVAEGRTGIVEVTILPGQDEYPASSRNGITSNAWGDYPASYTVRAAK